MSEERIAWFGFLNATKKRNPTLASTVMARIEVVSLFGWTAMHADHLHAPSCSATQKFMQERAIANSE